jgi:hypothetical protein
VTTPLPGTDKEAPLLAVGSGPARYRWQYDRLGHQLQPVVESEAAELQATAEATATVSASLQSDFAETVKWLKSRRSSVVDISLWETMRLVPTPPTWSYLEEAAQALKNPASLPRTKIDEYTRAFVDYRANLQAALARISHNPSRSDRAWLRDRGFWEQL